jgi:hypothetical protein
VAIALVTHRALMRCPGRYMARAARGVEGPETGNLHFGLTGQGPTGRYDALRGLSLLQLS